MIEVERLEKHFGSLRAVDGITLTAREGEVLGLLGPNGAGKTTTLRVLSTVMRPTGGTARIGGHDVKAEAAAVRTVLGVLPELWGLYGRLTPREHLRYFGRLHGMDGGSLERRIVELASMLGMEDFIDRRCEPFSKGMKQKVALGRALVHNPQHLLLDEPTAGLDVMSARSVRDLISRFRSEGRCVILSTHVLGEAERLCDCLAIMQRGRVVTSGSPEDLVRQAGKATLEEAFLHFVGPEAVEAQEGLA